MDSFGPTMMQMLVSDEPPVLYYFSVVVENTKLATTLALHVESRKGSGVWNREACPEYLRMANYRETSKAYVILEAVNLTIIAAIPQVHRLVVLYPEALSFELVLRILLTYLPEATEPEIYTDFLLHLKNGTLNELPDNNEKGLKIQNEISELEARQHVRRLHLLPITNPQRTDDASLDIFTRFILHRASRIGSETGSIHIVSQLVKPFIKHSEHLQVWAISTLLPLLRLHYDYYPEETPTYSLDEFEKLSGRAAVESLLSRAARQPKEEVNANIGRDIRGMVGPWMYGQNSSKRRKLDARQRRRSSVAVHASEDDNGTSEGVREEPWKELNEWLLNLATRDYMQAVEAFAQWDGPRDVDYGGWDNTGEEEVEHNVAKSLTRRYAQAGFAAIYATTASDLDTIEGSQRILQKIANRLDLSPPPELHTPNDDYFNDFPQAYLNSLSRSDLFHNSLLRDHNPLTSPSRNALSLASSLLCSGYILSSQGHPKACRDLLDLAVFESETEQMAELRSLLHTIQARTRDERSWEKIRHQTLWLREWISRPPDNPKAAITSNCGLFGKIASETIETELLKALLANSCYTLTANLYCSSEAPLPRAIVKRTLLDVAYASYDSASNGNKSRGGVRKASEIVKAFEDFFPDSQPLKNIKALIAATHAMSYYSLTLQHGVPFRPVNIRAHKDPMALMGKILAQNSRSYTKLDDLLDIGQNLVTAGLISLPEDNDTNDMGHTAMDHTLIAQRRVTSMAIEAALEENDFDTAYSYVVNRLPPLAKVTQPSSPPSDSHIDDISWRAAYKAGCYKPTEHLGSSSLRRLEQRMELLSQALLLAPSSSLAEILSVWRRFEEELTVVLSREDEEDNRWDAKGSRQVPGGFTQESVPTVQKSRQPSRAALSEEAPMGLFDVARGAAAALSKNAFPLRSPKTETSVGPFQSPHQRSLSMMGSGTSDSGSGTDAEGRVRKRDMVSNMVTGGLASGIGWVLGAPPVKQEE